MTRLPILSSNLIVICQWYPGVFTWITRVSHMVKGQFHSGTLWLSLLNQNHCQTKDNRLVSRCHFANVTTCTRLVFKKSCVVKRWDTHACLSAQCIYIYICETNNIKAVVINHCTIPTIIPNCVSANVPHITSIYSLSNAVIGRYVVGFDTNGVQSKLE